MKELIEKLRRFSLRLYSEGACMVAEAADAIERLENEAVAATLRIENDKAELDQLRVDLHEVWFANDGLKAARIAYASEFPVNSEGEPDVGNIHQNIRALKVERDALQKALETAHLHIKHIGNDALRTENAALRAELDKLKQQEPCATLHDDGYWTWNGTRPYKSDFAGWRLSVFLAAGASKPGYQLVPEEISEAMYAAYHKVDDAAWCAGSSNGANMSEIWDAMLEAANGEAK